MRSAQLVVSVLLLRAIALGASPFDRLVGTVAETTFESEAAICDLCRVNNGGCDPNALCSCFSRTVMGQLRPAIECSCKPGFSGDGSVCQNSGASCTNDNQCWPSTVLFCYRSSISPTTCNSPLTGTCRRARCEINPPQCSSSQTCANTGDNSAQCVTARVAPNCASCECAAGGVCHRVGGGQCKASNGQCQACAEEGDRCDINGRCVCGPAQRTCGGDTPSCRRGLCCHMTKCASANDCCFSDQCVNGQCRPLDDVCNRAQDCSGHGAPTGLVPQCSCVCDPLWTGPFCSAPRYSSSSAPFSSSSVPFSSSSAPFSSSSALFSSSSAPFSSSSAPFSSSSAPFSSSSAPFSSSSAPFSSSSAPFSSSSAPFSSSSAPFSSSSAPFSSSSTPFSSSSEAFSSSSAIAPSSSSSSAAQVAPDTPSVSLSLYDQGSDEGIAQFDLSMLSLGTCVGASIVIGAQRVDGTVMGLNTPTCTGYFDNPGQTSDYSNKFGGAVDCVFVKACPDCGSCECTWQFTIQILCASGAPDSAVGFSSPTTSGPCFPLDSRVTLESGEDIALRALQPGDRVAAIDADGNLAYTTFYTWFHKQDAVWARFLRIYHSCSDDAAESATAPTCAMDISATHLIHRVRNRLHGDENSSGTLDIVKAQDVAVGDFMLATTTQIRLGHALRPVRVQRIEHVAHQGFCAPATGLGTVIVDGVGASAYAGANATHAAFHAWAQPVLALYEHVLTPLTSWDKPAASDGILATAVKRVLPFYEMSQSNGWHWWSRTRVFLRDVFDPLKSTTHAHVAEMEGDSAAMDAVLNENLVVLALHWIAKQAGRACAYLAFDVLRPLLLLAAPSSNNIY